MKICVAQVQKVLATHRSFLCAKNTKGRYMESGVFPLRKAEFMVE